MVRSSVAEQLRALAGVETDRCVLTWYVDVDGRDRPRHTDVMQAAEQVIVLAIGTRKKSGEMPKANSSQADTCLKALEGMGVVRTDAIDQYLSQLADLARASNGKGKHVPERETKIIDQDFAPGLRRPPAGQRMKHTARCPPS